MSADEKLIFRWYGAAHYHLLYKGRRVIIDPLYERVPKAKPYLNSVKEDVEQLDYLLLTHAHMDHSWDFPYLASKHKPIAYAPEKYLTYLKKKEHKWNFDFNFSKCHSLEQETGKPFSIADINVTPYHIGTEEIDFSVIYNSFIRGFRHWSFGVTSAGTKFLFNHLKGNCFAFHFNLLSINKTMLFLGNVTDQVYDMDDIKEVNVLALPYCPASSAWLDHTLYLIGRFKSDVILIHHYDNFWHPITHPMYRNLKDYRNSINAVYPEAKLFFSRFFQDIELSEILDEI